MRPSASGTTPTPDSRTASTLRRRLSGAGLGRRLGRHRARQQAASPARASARPIPRPHLEDASEHGASEAASLTRWRRPLPAAAAVRRVDFLSKGRTVGQVVVFLPLDRSLVGWLTRACQPPELTRSSALAVARASSAATPDAADRVRCARAEAGDIRAGGVGYRTVCRGSRLRCRRDPARRARAQLRHRLEGESGALARGRSRLRRSSSALLAMAYAVSPSIARSRVSRQERERAERVLAHVGDGVFLVDHDGVIRLWNPAAEAITGLRADAICDRPAAEAIPGWPAVAARIPGGAPARRDRRRVERRDRAAGDRRAGDLALDRRRHACPTASCTRSAT